MATRRLFLAPLIFSASIAAQNPPPSLTTLYSFTGNSDGGRPTQGMLVGANGVLYGATSKGGAYNFGAIFSLTPPATPGGSWTETVLYSFTGDVDGLAPTLYVIGSGGVLYGIAVDGGISHGGAVFSLTPPSSAGGTWSFTILHAFDGFASVPSGLVIGTAGTLYGGTINGGTYGHGMVFALIPPASPGGPWTERMVYSFTGYIGSYLSFVIDSQGVLYGATAGGGIYSLGMVFALTPPASSGEAWTETEVHSFAGGSADGDSVWSPLVIGSGGVLYGTTVMGGASDAGTIFSLTPPATPGGAWTEAVLYQFMSLHGHYPNPGSVILGKSGVLYGTTLAGGASFAGTIFVLRPPASPGSSWTEEFLHEFTVSDGSAPNRLVINEGGVLYGTTVLGGAYNNGTVFALTE